jgi:hypothetical protein
MSLDGNMKLGIAAAAYVRQKVPKSANYKFTSSVITFNSKPLKMMTARDSDLANLRATYDKPGKGDDAAAIWKKICANVAKIEKRGIGNCGEVAAVALVYLKSTGTSETLDYVYIIDGATSNAVVPHVVAVIGRGGDTTLDIGLPGTWSADAVICDPWDRVVYPAKDYDFYWKGLKTHSSRPNDLTCQLKLRVP